MTGQLRSAVQGAIHMDREQRTLYRTMAVSGVLHLVLIGVMVAAPRLAPRSAVPAPIISVNLVPMPKSPGAGLPAPKPAKRPSKTEKTVKPAPKPKPAKAVVIEKKPEISLAPAKKRAKPLPKPKVSMKKKTFKAPVVREKAIEKMEKKVTEAETQSRQAALDQLRKKVATQQVARETDPPPDSPTIGSGAGTGEAAGAAGKLVSQAEGAYIGEAALTIETNWAYSEQLAGGRSDLAVLLGVKILASGEIADVWYDQRSGNRYLDEAARKAVLKSNPLAPFPPEIRKSHIKFGLRFSPEGLF